MVDVIRETYEHSQTVAANVWVIAHNLNQEQPVVDITLDSGQSGITVLEDEIIIAYDVTVDSSNQITVTVLDPNNAAAATGVTGRARVV